MVAERYPAHPTDAELDENQPESGYTQYTLNHQLL